jgi:hypothetical protein
MSRVKSGRVPKAHHEFRRHLEGFDCNDVASDQMREIVEESFPDLLAKLPPRVKRHPELPPLRHEELPPPSGS